MENREQINVILDACDTRRDARRAFLKSSGTAALFAGGAALAACGGGGGGRGDDPIVVNPGVPGANPGTPPPVGTLSDADILNFALNLEYLEAQFYAFAAFGTGLPANLLTGTGTQGGVTGGRQVAFTDPVVGQHAREIAVDERQHVAFLRSALGSAAVAQPAIDISASATGPFSAAARAAGLIGPGQSFDPYANDENFLLGAFIFEDVGVTAYKGASPLIANKTFLEAAAGILAAEAYHAGLIRTVLYGKGLQTPSLRTATEQISDARDRLDGPSDVDQGVAMRGNQSNIVPADNNAIVYSRSPGDVLNIVYLTDATATQGGFYPAGVNGTIRASTAG